MSIFVDMRTYAISATPGLHNPSLMYLFRCQYVLDTNLENPFQFFKDVVPYEPCLIVLNDASYPHPNATKVFDPRSFAKHLMAFVDLYRPASCTVVCAQSRGKQFAESVREVLAEAVHVHHLPPFSSLVVEGLTDGAVSWTPDGAMPMNLDLLAWMLTKLVSQDNFVNRDNTWHHRYINMFARSAYSRVALHMALDAIHQYQYGVAKVAINVPYYRDMCVLVDAL